MIYSNVLVIDRRRIDYNVSLSTRLIATMDFIAIDNDNGTVSVIKNRFDGKTGIMAREVFELRVEYYHMVMYDK